MKISSERVSPATATKGTAALDEGAVSSSKGTRTAQVDAFDPTPVPPTPKAPPPEPLPPTPIETLYADPFRHDVIGDRLVELLDEAKTTIDGAFYEIADERILGGFIRAAQRGVAVRLVTDDNYFRNEDSQALLDHHVAVLTPAYEFLKDVRLLRPEKPEHVEWAKDLLAQLPSVRQNAEAGQLPEHLAIDFVPVERYLTAFAAQDAYGISEYRNKSNSVTGSAGSDLGAEKVRQLFRPHYDALLEAGVKLRDDDDTSNLSHNKYLVADGRQVFMGSYNLQGLKAEHGPNAGLYRTADNALVLSSPTLAKTFLEDFKQMFEEGRFNSDKSEISGRAVRINGVQVTPFFSPKDPLIANITADLGTLLNRMRAANERGEPMTPPPTIRVAGFAMSYNGTEAMVDMLSLLHREGADVQVVADALSAGSSSSSVKALRERGVPVIVTDNAVMMHHKFLSVEAGRTNFVYTGSANFTHPAYFDNDESVLKLESEKMAEAYRAIFDSLRDDEKQQDAVIDAREAAPTENTWEELDPTTIRSLAQAQEYARLRWGW